MNKATIKGRVVSVGKTREIGNKGFKKRPAVVDTGGKWPNPLEIEAVKDNTGILDGIREGDEVEVEVYIRGREYNGRHYTNLVASTVTRLDRTGGHNRVANAHNERLPEEASGEEIPW